MPRPTAEIDSLFCALDWKVTGAGRFSRTSHINIQEARAFKMDIRRVSMDKLRAGPAGRAAVGQT
eukprot:14005775-Heterocapsa_arctica.AAC.1